MKWSIKKSKTSPKTLVRKFFPWRRSPKSQKTVCEALSERLSAYAVFQPRPDNFFKLFEVIFLHQNRHLSPRNTNANLREMSEDLQGPEQDKTMRDSFLKEFRKFRHREFNHDPEFMEVSEESLVNAGLTLPLPSANVSAKVSRSQTKARQLRLSWLSMDAYTGRKNLQQLIWKHAKAVFLLLILQGLDCSYFPRRRGERALMGIVTRRLISKVGVSQMYETDTAIKLEADPGIEGGVGMKKALREAYRDLYGVSGLHFIAFKVECVDRYHWKIYKGIDVCDSELDESDDFNEAVRWHRGTGDLNNATRGNYKAITDGGSSRSGADTENEALEDERAHDNGEAVVQYVHQTRRFVEVDIKPRLSELANKQCKLAAYYRKTDRSNAEKMSQVVSILRSVLQKNRFESTVRALYDLSRCYLHGIGVKVDDNMARLLRYCAGGMKRSYYSGLWWLQRLAMEMRLNSDDIPERSIVPIALLSRWRLTSIPGITRIYSGQEDSTNSADQEEQNLEPETDHDLAITSQDTAMGAQVVEDEVQLLPSEEMSHKFSLRANLRRCKDIVSEKIHDPPWRRRKGRRG